MNRKPFKDIRQGEHFKEIGGDRKFIKLQTLLPSGLKQTVHRAVDGRLDNDEFFNAVDYKGVLAKCPDWVDFIIIK